MLRASLASWKYRGRNPGIRVAGICDRTNAPPENGTLSAFDAARTRAFLDGAERVVLDNQRSFCLIYAWQRRAAVNCVSHFAVLPSEETTN